MNDNQPLNILIVGAGIGGLTAAVALRRQGHTVKIFERSRFANELGVAIHLPPNASSLLRRFGLRLEEFGAVDLCWHTEYAADGKLLKQVDVTKTAGMWQSGWLLAHRAHLHTALKQLATAEGGEGRPVELTTSCGVVDIDCTQATVKLEGGQEVCGDMVLVADGVHSMLRNKVVVDGPTTPFPSGKSAYRFLVPRSAALEDPQTAPLVEKNGELMSWNAADRGIVIYSCHYNELLNFVCIHPDTSNSSSHGWNGAATKDSLLKTYKGFSPAILALLDKADPKTLNLWQLLDLQPLKTWVNARVALLGDAAHPFLPYQAQGGAQAIEDAVSLAAVLPLGTRHEEIHERLMLYQQCRYERASTVQEFTRKTGAARLGGGEKVDAMRYTLYNFGHDEWHHSTHKLHQWEVTRNPPMHCHMPLPFNSSHRETVSTYVTASIKFKTSRTLLQTLFPTNSFSFSSQATVVTATLSATALDGVEWLGGMGYMHLGLYVHGVQYIASDGTLIRGRYLPLLFTSDPDATQRLREEIGWPALCTSLEITRESDSCAITSSYRGANFATFSLFGLTLAEGCDNTSESILSYKYIPHIGGSGKSDVEYAVHSQGIGGSVTRRYVAEKANFDFRKGEAEKFPGTLRNTVNWMAEMPVFEVLGGELVEGTGASEVEGTKV